MFAKNSQWQLKVRVWVEKDGEKILGPGRIELMQQIHRLHSISAAARAMKMSYRRAWTLVQSINNTAGELLIDSTTGGSGGGGASLTPRGVDVLHHYQRLVKRLLLAARRTSRTSK